MNTEKKAHPLESACISCLASTCNAENLAWTPHPTFAGVSMKALVTSQTTGGAMSCHLVRVDPQCCLESHIHEQQHELHHVAAGSAKVEVDGRSMQYSPGDLNVIAKGATHRVMAGPEGIMLLAVFTPPLI